MIGERGPLGHTFDLTMKCEIGSDAILEHILNFGESSSIWWFDHHRSLKYSMLVPGRHRSAVLVNKNQECDCVLVFSSRSEMRVDLVNIVPREKIIPVEKYNAILTSFADDFRSFIRGSKGQVSVKIIKPRDQKNLPDIISAEIPRRLFLRYIFHYPVLYHPTEQKKLDAFVCAYHRFARKPLNISALKRYLIEDQGWSDKSASNCVHRIDVGLQILKAYKSCYVSSDGSTYWS